jgi:hypothetical protein
MNANIKCDEVLVWLRKYEVLRTGVAPGTCWLVSWLVGWLVIVWLDGYLFG